MGTLIKSIAFENFYNYYGSFDNNIYEFSEGINIINADNNMGKSKFYNGFLWVIKDQVYDSDEDKMKDVDNSYFKMVSVKARLESDTTNMGVRIIFDNGGVRYKVEKLVSCRKEDGEWKFYPQTQVTRTTDSEDLPLLDKDEIKEAIRLLIPADMENYSLLQGESMEKLVDLSNKDGLVRTINALADINNVKEMCDLAERLVAVADKDKKDEEKRNQNASREALELRKERDDTERWIAESQEKIRIAQDELASAQEIEQRIESEFLSSKKRLQVGAEYKQEREQLDRLRSEKERLELSVTSRLFDENCPWILMGLGDEIDVFDKNRIELVANLAAASVQQNPDIILPEGSPDTPSLKRMLKNEFCEVCGRPAPKGSEEWLHIKKVLERPQKPMLSSDSFVQFYGDIQKEVGRYSTTIPSILDDYQHYMDKMFDLDERISAQEEVVVRKEDELALVGSESSSEDADRIILSKYNQAKTIIKDKTDLINLHTNKIKRWELALDKINKDLEKCQQSAPIKKAQETLELMKTVAEIFKNTKDAIFSEIVSNLEGYANKMYSELTAGNQTTGGHLKFQMQDDNQTVKVTVLNNAGEELHGNGKGFKRMKQLAIVMSIISSKIGNKRFDYPFISDAPFSEFGGNFINNFLNMAPKVFRQSIIMIKDLYDPNDVQYITPAGKQIVDKMKKGEMPGTFYVNWVKERADQSNLVTDKKDYSR